MYLIIHFFVIVSSSYKLTVQASDRGPQSLHARASVTITIEDINDNSPIFQGEPYKRSVPEDFSTNSDLLKVRISRNLLTFS